MTFKISQLTKCVGAALIALGTALPAIAGPYILSGTDADDHGFATSTSNQQGWFFMQRALENLAPAVTNNNKVVVSLVSDPGSTAGQAAQSAFKFSNLAAAGWTYVNLNGAAAINNFFSGIGAITASTAGLLMFDSGNNVSGGLTTTEDAALTSNASAIDAFLGTGGGLFSQSNSYGWLNAILPSASAQNESFTGISLTSAGANSFPVLTNADLSAGPYHTYFQGIGGIPVLGTSQTTGHAVIIGSSAGSITNPGQGTVPEPGNIALFGLGALALTVMRRRQTNM